MISAGLIYDKIQSFAPFETAMDFDNVGLLIGNTEQKSDIVLLALDITSDIINEAIIKKAKIIVTHHPIIFHPLKKISSESLVFKLVKNDITVISAHTNLDLAKGGVNDTLANTIGVFSENGTNDDCLLVGTLQNEFTSESFAQHIKNVLNCCGLRFTKRYGKIRRVGVACGAGGESIFAAAAENADAFVTGEIKHHELLYAQEKNIAVYDLGHFRSEDLIINKLTSYLSESFPDTTFVHSENDTEKIFYLT